MPIPLSLRRYLCADLTKAPTTDRGLTKDTKNTNTNMNHGAYRPSSTESSPAFAQSQLQSSESLLKCTSSSSSHPIPSTPPLRRKKSHFVLHMSAPPQTKTHPSAPSQDIRQRHQSQPALHSDEGFTSAQSLRVPITDIRRPRHAYSRSEPPQHPLGHPNRPYYTALRKGMSPGSFSSSSMPPVDIFSTPSAAAPPLHSSTLSSVSSSPSRAPSPSLTSSSAFCHPYPYPYPYSYPNYPPTSFSDDTHGHSTALDDGSLAGSNPFEFGLGLRSWPSPPSLPASSADEPTTIIFSAISPEKRRKSGSVDLSSFKLKTKFSLRRHNLVSSVSSTSTSPSLLTSTSMITPITPLSPPTSPPTVFSKSDETMIRLALAREVRSHHARGGGIGNENGMVNDDEVLARADAEKFVYHGREKSMSMSMMMMKMKMRVKRLSRELKETFGVWACSPSTLDACVQVFEYEPICIINEYLYNT
ncbi:hypothetical protein D9757_009112 [Collybiopsis confluens]|uniref:Uncharacterized protein n=1 Tax=Collybiopsis confluens TaxID=2823264 RepID=A0A8H5H9A6_9AGAR|nr:hypothetical protein D9757_009112 [Collybiopsis confluens]